MRSKVHDKNPYTFFYQVYSIDTYTPVTLIALKCKYQSLPTNPSIWETVLWSNDYDERCFRSSFADSREGDKGRTSPFTLDDTILGLSTRLCPGLAS